MPNNIPENLTNKKSWSQSGLIVCPAGRRARGGVSLSADFTQTKVEGYFTVQFNIIPKVIPEIGFVPRVRATIAWNVDGNDVRREIDIVDGSAISGTGQGVTVKITDNSLNSMAPPNEAQYVVSAQIAPGCRPTWAGADPPVRIADLDGAGNIVNGNVFAVGAGLAVERNIPPDAGVNAVYTQAHSANPPITEFDDITFIQRTFGHTDIAMIKLFNASGKWMPIFPGATKVRIFNNTANAVFVSVLWGVEG